MAEEYTVGLEGPNSEYMKLISGDGHIFILKREHAYAAATIRAMFTGPGRFNANKENEVALTDFGSHVLHVLCKYLVYKSRYSNVVDMAAPNFDVPVEVAVEMLYLSSFLDC